MKKIKCPCLCHSDLSMMHITTCCDNGYISSPENLKELVEQQEHFLYPAESKKMILRVVDLIELHLKSKGIDIEKLF